MTTRLSRRTLLAQLCGGLGLAAYTPIAQAEPEVCSNEPLMDALRVLHRACKPLESCDFSQLRTLNDRRYRDVLLAAMNKAELNPVHIFFPDDVSDLASCFDWGTTKQSQLNTLSYFSNIREATVYLIGRASQTGSVRHNRMLSEQRMAGVRRYLKDDLDIPCREFRGAWMGKEILQFTTSDAAFLRIPENDYRKSELVLNQAVHIFAVPCSRLGL